MHDNSGYGFDPHDDSNFLAIHDNEAYANECQYRYGLYKLVHSWDCSGRLAQARLIPYIDNVNGRNRGGCNTVRDNRNSLITAKIFGSCIAVNLFYM